MPPPQTLATLEPGQKAQVIKVVGSGAVRRRLIDMGLTPGTQLELVRRAPLGDPLVFRLKGYLLSMRSTEAVLVEVELEENGGKVLLTLTQARPLVSYRVVSIQGGKGQFRRLARLGVVEGSRLVVESGSTGRGGIPVRLGERHLRVPRGMAARVLVMEDIVLSGDEDT
jgi:ferrous iron transport protein A